VRDAAKRDNRTRPIANFNLRERDYVTKPFNHQELIERVLRCCVA